LACALIERSSLKGNAKQGEDFAHWCELGVIGHEDYLMNRYCLPLGGLIWGILLGANCAQVFAWESRSNPLAVRSEFSDQSFVSPERLKPPLRSPHSLAPVSIPQFPSYRAAQAAEVPAQPSSFWASQSLARLIRQHDCAPQRSASEPLSIDNGYNIDRYKMAALLFSCLEHWDKQTFDIQEKDALQALRTEFKLELVALRGNNLSNPIPSLANIPHESIRPGLSPQTSDSLANVPISTTEYNQSFNITAQGRVAMGVHYTDRTTSAVTRNLLGINAEASLGKVGVFGRYSAALGDQLGRSDSSISNLFGDRSIQAWSAGVGIRDFMIQHSVLTVSVSQNILPNHLSQSAQTHYGAFYQFPLTERLTLSPSIVIMTDAEKTGATPDVQGTIQASFSF
jgi:hypothetical protein